MTTGYKVLTHKFCSPIQGGGPIWDGKTLPFTLPKVKLSKSQVECDAGWNYVEDMATGLSIAGFWPDGWPAVVVEIEPSKDAIARGNKRRASQLTIMRQLDDETIYGAIRALSVRWFGDIDMEMAEEQIAWFKALGRPYWNEKAVEEGLTLALKTRGLEN